MALVVYTYDGTWDEVHNIHEFTRKGIYTRHLRVTRNDLVYNTHRVLRNVLRYHLSFLHPVCAILNNKKQTGYIKYYIIQ